MNVTAEDGVRHFGWNGRYAFNIVVTLCFAALCGLIYATPVSADPCDVSRAASEAARSAAESARATIRQTVRDSVSGAVNRNQPHVSNKVKEPKKPASKQTVQPGLKETAGETSSSYSQRLQQIERRIERQDIKDWLKANVHFGSDPIGISASTRGVTIDCPVFFEKWQGADAQLSVLLFESGKALASIIQERSDSWRESHSEPSSETQAAAELQKIASNASIDSVIAMTRVREGSVGSGVDPTTGSFENTIGVLFRELALAKQGTKLSEESVVKLNSFLQRWPLSLAQPRK